MLLPGQSVTGTSAARRALDYEFDWSFDWEGPLPGLVLIPAAKLLPRTLSAAAEQNVVSFRDAAMAFGDFDLRTVVDDGRAIFSKW